MTPAEVAIVFGGIATPLAASFGAWMAWRGSRKTNLTNAEASKQATAVLAKEAGTHEFAAIISGFKDALAEVKDQFTALDRKHDSLQAESAVQATTIAALQIHVQLSDRRENLMYHHTKALREHILSELPPPPPVMPQELVEWFEEFERTDPHRTH